MKIKEGLMQSVLEIEKENIKQSRLRKKHSIEDENVKVVEKSSLVKYLIQVIQIVSSIILYILAIIGIIALIYPGPRVGLQGVYKEVITQLTLLLKGGSV